MLVNGPHAAEVAAAGHGNLRVAEAAQQRADEIIGGAQLMSKRLRDMSGGNICTVDFHIRGVEKTNVCAKLREDLEQNRHVGNLGNVFDAYNPVYQQRGRNNGDRCVLGAADMHLAKERTTASYNIFLHRNSYQKRNSGKVPAVSLLSFT